MFAGLARFALAASVALPSTAAAQAFEYAPGTGQYRITVTSKAAQEAMGQKQEGETSASQLVTVTVARPTKDTLAMTVVLDSLSVVGLMGMTPPGLDELLGMTVSAKLSPGGALYSSRGPDDSTMASGTGLVEGLSTILPRITGRMAAGSTWTDTISGKIRQGGLEVDRQVISKFTVVGDTSVAGESGWKINRESNTSLSGSGMPQGQAATMEGTSNAKSTLVVSRNGVFVGSETEDEADIKIVLAANGMEIGVKQTTNTKIEKVK